MKTLKVYIKDESSEAYKQLVKLLLEFSSEIAFEEEKTGQTYEGKDGKIRPWSMPFGKYKGKSIERIPIDYIKWQLSEFYKNKLLKAAGKTKNEEGKPLFILSDEIVDVFEKEAEVQGLNTEFLKTKAGREVK